MNIHITHKSPPQGDQPKIQVHPGLHIGSRGADFKMCITNILKKGKFVSDIIDLLTDEQSMEVYAAAFTSDMVDETNNYQMMEQIGDLAIGKFIISYSYKKFPQLKCAEGVKIAARLKINYGSKETLAGIAEKFGFWPFISAPNDTRMLRQQDLLEDTFEAFIGATEMILDERKGDKVGIGYAHVYRILKNIFDGMKLSLEYEDLFDAKTRLQELFNYYEMKGKPLGKLEYRQMTVDSEEKKIAYTHISLFMVLGASKTLIGKGESRQKIAAEKQAAEEGLKTLAAKGIKKPVPFLYQKLTSDQEVKKTTADDVVFLLRSYSSNNPFTDVKEVINTLFHTRGKSKNAKYLSSVLASYCRKRDYDGIKACLELGADPNVLDTYGCSCLDLLLLGKTREKLLKHTMKRFFDTTEKLIISKNIYESYYTLYKDEFFEEAVEKLKIN